MCNQCTQEHVKKSFYVSSQFVYITCENNTFLVFLYLWPTSFWCYVCHCVSVSAYTSIETACQFTGAMWSAIEEDFVLSFIDVVY